MRITGRGPTYRERLKGRFSCRECREMMVAGSLTSHLMTQHGGVTETQWMFITLAAEAGPQTFRMTFPSKGVPWSCPVEGCPGGAAIRTAMPVHFLYRHVLDTVVVLEEVNLPHPGCTRCNILFPYRALNGRHPAKAHCARGAERKRRRLAEAEIWESLERFSEAYGELLENVTTFRYLVRVLAAGDNDFLLVVGNLGKARKSWGRLSRILIQEGGDPKMLESFYKAVAQAMMLLGAETWVLAPRMERALDSF